VTDTISSWTHVGETITKWSELAGLVEKYRANTWIFRGVDDAKRHLQPAIGRSGARKDMNTAAPAVGRRGSVCAPVAASW
jgi:hypothetical protein